MMPPYLVPLAHHLWQSTLFAAAAGLLTLAFRTNRAPVRYGLWMAASFKFLVPFSVLMALGHLLGPRPAEATPPAPLAVVVHQISEPFAPPVGGRWAPTPHSSETLLPAILFGIWACGFLTALAPWVNRWRRVRTAVRVARPLALDLPIPVLSSSLGVEPGIFGIRRPILLLPDGLMDHLSPAQLDAVLAHELCHVRRRDNLAAAIHMVVEALFWFHPLVWWLESRLVEEREQACDEEVLRSARNPEVYAEGILNVCKLYVGSPVVCISGVTGANLKRRIEAIMTQRAVRQMTAAKKLLLVTVGVASVTLPVVVGIVGLPVGFAQSQDAPIRAEVVSIKRNTTEDQRSGGMSRAEPGGKLTIRGVPLYFIIARAFQVPIQSPRLSGGPDWIRSERYDIEAIAPAGSIPADLPADERYHRIALMLQGILADRFKMQMRRETKEIPVYALVIGKGGPNLQKSQFEEKDCAAANGTPAPNAAPCHAFNGGQGRGLHSKAANMDDVVQFVENWTDRPFLNKTGLDGLYAIETDGWTPMRPRVQPNPAPGTTPTPEDLAYADPTTPTIFNIFERLGLRMESQKAPVETYVIEHIERPTEN